LAGLDSAAPQMGKVNFGYILGWSVVTMLALHWLFNMLAGAAQARRSAAVTSAVRSHPSRE